METNYLDLYKPSENLTLFEKITLKHFVSLKFEKLLHSYMLQNREASSKYATYLTLVETASKYYGDICKILIDGEFATEETVEQCLTYIAAGTIPYQIWVEKLLADVKNYSIYRGSSVGSLLTVYLSKTMRASLIAFNKAILALEEVDYFNNPDVEEAVMFNKTRYLEIPQRAKEDYRKLFTFGSNNESNIVISEIKRRQVADNELSIFRETLVDMLQRPIKMSSLELCESGMLGAMVKYWQDPMSFGSGMMQAAPVSAGDGQVATAAEPSVAGSPAMDMPKGNAPDFLMGCWWVLAGWGENGETPEDEELAGRIMEVLPEDSEVDNLEDYDDFELETTIAKKVEEPVKKEDSNVQYAVKKIAKNGSKREVSCKWFNSYEKALEFKKEMDRICEESPEMASNFEFKLEAGRKPTIGGK